MKSISDEEVDLSKEKTISIRIGQSQRLANEYLIQTPQSNAFQEDQFQILAQNILDEKIYAISLRVIRSLSEMKEQQKVLQIMSRIDHSNVPKYYRSWLEAHHSQIIITEENISSLESSAEDNNSPAEEASFIQSQMYIQSEPYNMPFSSFIEILKSHCKKYAPQQNHSQQEQQQQLVNQTEYQQWMNMQDGLKLLLWQRIHPIAGILTLLQSHNVYFKQIDLRESMFINYQNQLLLGYCHHLKHVSSNNKDMKMEMQKKNLQELERVIEEVFFENQMFRIAHEIKERVRAIFQEHYSTLITKDEKIDYTSLMGYIGKAILLQQEYNNLKNDQKIQLHVQKENEQGNELYWCSFDQKQNLLLCYLNQNDSKPEYVYNLKNFTLKFEINRTITAILLSDKLIGCRIQAFEHQQFNILNELFCSQDSIIS